MAPIPGRPCLTGLLWQLLVSILIHDHLSVYVLRDREFAKVVANHLRLDLNSVELLARVDTNDGTNHLWDDDHVAEVGLDGVWLLVWLGLLLGLAELFDQAHGLALEATVEPSTGTGVDDIAELLGGEVEEPVKRLSAQGLGLGPRKICVVQRTHRGQCHGKRTCGTLSFSSTLFELYQPDILSSSAPIRPNRRVSSILRTSCLLWVLGVRQ